MFKKLALNLLFSAIKSLLDAGLFAWIQETVATIAAQGLKGEAARAAFAELLKNLKGTLGTIAVMTSSTLINLAMEAAVAKLKAAEGKLNG